MANKYLKRCLTSPIIKEIQVKSIMRYHFTFITMASNKITGNKMCWHVCGEIGIPVHYWWECKMIQPWWKIKKIQNRTTIQPSNSTSEYISQRTESRSQRDICTPIFIAALFTITKRWKQSKFPPTDDDKMWTIRTTCTIDYPTLKRKEILTHATHS